VTPVQNLMWNLGFLRNCAITVYLPAVTLERHAIMMSHIPIHNDGSNIHFTVEENLNGSIRGIGKRRMMSRNTNCTCTIPYIIISLVENNESMSHPGDCGMELTDTTGTGYY
jgi:hypothetical protein